MFYCNENNAAMVVSSRINRLGYVMNNRNRHKQKSQFRPKMIFLGSDSILGVKTMVVSQPHSVLS